LTKKEFSSIIKNILDTANNQHCLSVDTALFATLAKDQDINVDFFGKLIYDDIKTDINGNPYVWSSWSVVGFLVMQLSDVCSSIGRYSLSSKGDYTKAISNIESIIKTLVDRGLDLNTCEGLRKKVGGFYRPTRLPFHILNQWRSHNSNHTNYIIDNQEQLLGFLDFFRDLGCDFGLLVDGVTPAAIFMSELNFTDGSIVLKWLLTNNFINPTETYDLSLYQYDAIPETTAFLQLCRGGKLKQIRMYLDHFKDQVNIHETDSLGNNAIMYAAHSWNSVAPAVFDLLIKLGVTPSSNSKDETPFTKTILSPKVRAILKKAFSQSISDEQVSTWKVSRVVNRLSELTSSESIALIRFLSQLSPTQLKAALLQKGSQESQDALTSALSLVAKGKG